MAESDEARQVLVGRNGSLAVGDDDEITRKLCMLAEGECEGLGPVEAARMRPTWPSRCWPAWKVRCASRTTPLSSRTTTLPTPNDLGRTTSNCLVAGNSTVDLKALAASVGEKKLRMATHREAESLTGLQVGGISALALLNRGFDVCIDRGAEDLQQVLVSAGKRGINLQVAVSDLVRVTSARWVNAGGRSG